MPVSPQQVHIDAALTNLAIAYIQEASQFVARRVFPVVPVGKQSDYYYEFARDAFLRSTARRRAPGTRAVQKNFTVSTERYSCDVHAVEIPVSIEARGNADRALDLDLAAMHSVVNDLLITQEGQFLDLAFKTNVWGTDITGVASSPGAGQAFQWSDGVNSDPMTDIETGRNAIWRATGIKPNTLVVGPEVHSALKHHPLTVERYKYTSADSITEEMIARVYEVDRYLVAGGVGVTSAEGATIATAFLAGKKALLCYAPDSPPTIMEPSAGITFAWSGVFGAENGMGIAVDQYQDEATLSDYIRGHLAHDMKVTGADLGYFFNSIVA